MAYVEVVEMLGDNLASFLELAKKWLIEWKIDLKNLFHFFHNLKKDDLVGLLNGTHQIQKVSISKFFQETIVINVSKNPESFTINEKSVMKFMEPIIKREKELKNPDPDLNDIWKDYHFMDKIVPGFEKDLFSTIYRFVVGIIHRQIFEEAENCGVKKVYSYLEALSVIRQTILAGEVDEKVEDIYKIKDIFVYFEFNHSLFIFLVRRYNGKLFIVRKDYDPNEQVNVGSGICFN